MDVPVMSGVTRKSTNRGVGVGSQASSRDVWSYQKICRYSNKGSVDDPEMSEPMHPRS